MLRREVEPRPRPIARVVLAILCGCFAAMLAVQQYAEHRRTRLDAILDYYPLPPHRR